MENGTNCPRPCDTRQVEQSLKDRINSLEKLREELMLRVTVLEEHVRQLQRFTGVDNQLTKIINYV